MHHKVHWSLPDASTDTGSDNDLAEEKEMGCKSAGIHKHHCLENPQYYEEDNLDHEKDTREHKECHTALGSTRRTEGNKDDRIAMDSLKHGKWLTCTVIDRQMSS